MLGNVTAEAFAQWGSSGDVYRYDDVYRLTDWYQGVDLSGTNLDTFADPANTPSAFQLHTQYALDNQGNRTAVATVDSSATTTDSFAYTPNANTNVYDNVDGFALNYNAKEELTFDPATGNYYAYDYRGQRILVDGNSDFSSPERIYTYDAHGRLRLEEHHSGGSGLFAYAYTYAPALGSPPTILESYQFFNTGAWVSTNQLISYVYGFGANASDGGCGVENPLTATSLPRGASTGSYCVAELADNGTTTEWHFNLEDQLNSVQGVVDANGTVLRQIDHNDYGLTVEQRIVYETNDGALDTTSDTNVNGLTTINLIGGAADPSAYVGHRAAVVGADGSSLFSTVVVAASPGQVTLLDTANAIGALSIDPRLVIFSEKNGFAEIRDDSPTVDSADPGISLAWNGVFAQLELSDPSVVLAGTAGSTIVLNLNFGGGDTQVYVTTILSELDPVTVVVQHWADLNPLFLPTVDSYQVYAAPTGAPALVGQVGATATNNGGETQLYSETDVPGNLAGAFIFVNGNTNEFLPIESAAGRILTVAGDHRNLISKGDTYFIVPPYAVDSATGTVHTDQIAASIRHPWAMGVHLTGPVAEQSGSQKGGHVYFWNRIYNPDLGRWETPDPAAMPWWNLQEYGSNNPARALDRSGLASWATDMVPHDGEGGQGDGGARSRALNEDSDSASPPRAPTAEESARRLRAHYAAWIRRRWPESGYARRGYWFSPSEFRGTSYDQWVQQMVHRMMNPPDPPPPWTDETRPPPSGTDVPINEEPDDVTRITRSWKNDGRQPPAAPGGGMNNGPLPRTPADNRAGSAG